MKKLTIIIASLFILLSTTVVAKEVQKYVLALADYPIYVDGERYSNSELPTLNYNNGNTYVPLSAIGDLMGLEYSWNSELRRVEITRQGNPSYEEETIHEETIISRELTEIEILQELTEGLEIEVDYTTGLKVIGQYSDGSDLIALVVYDEQGRYVGQYIDSDDTNLVIAQLSRHQVLPPKISEGWISETLLSKIVPIDVAYDGDDVVINTHPFVTQQREYMRISVPQDWKDIRTGEATSDSITIKKYNGTIYIKIDDLIQAGVL